MTLLVRVGEVTEFSHRPATPYRLNWTLTPPGATRIRKSAYADERDRLIRFREELREATTDPGRQWDLRTGLPQGLARPGPHRDPARGRRRRTAADDAARGVILLDLIADLRRLWPDLPSGTRKSDTDQLVAIAAGLLRADTPALDNQQRGLFRRWVRDTLAPRAVAAAPAAGTRAALEDDAWRALVARHGLRWYELDEDACRAVLAVARRRADGVGSVGRQTLGHRWAYVKRVVGDAVPARLPSNPLDRIPAKEQPSTTARVRPVDARLVIGMPAVLAILEAFAELVTTHDASPWHTVRVGLQGLAGLRPEEAWATDPDTDHRPGRGSEGWGELDVLSAAPRPGSRYTDDGAQVDRRGPKTVDRTVPTCPPLDALVAAARAADARAGRCRPDLDDPAERNRGDRLLTAAIARARAAGHGIPTGFTGEHLRHTRISLQLATKELPDALVALWSGHSTMTQKRSYEGVIHTKDLRAELDAQRHLLVPPAYRQDTAPVAAPAALAGTAAELTGLLPAIAAGHLSGPTLAGLLRTIADAVSDDDVQMPPG